MLQAEALGLEVRHEWLGKQEERPGDRLRSWLAAQARELAGPCDGVVDITKDSEVEAFKGRLQLWIDQLESEDIVLPRPVLPNELVVLQHLRPSGLSSTRGRLPLQVRVGVMISHPAHN